MSSLIFVSNLRHHANGILLIGVVTKLRLRKGGGTTGGGHGRNSSPVKFRIRFVYFDTCSCAFTTQQCQLVAVC